MHVCAYRKPIGSSYSPHTHVPAPSVHISFGNRSGSCAQGVRQAAGDPSEYLFVSLANLAIRTGLFGEARYWLREGTNTKRGAGSNALWTTWGNMEWKQAGDAQAAAYCFDMALRCHPRSRYAFLSYAMMEKALGNIASARALLQRGAKLNPTDAPLRQVRVMSVYQRSARLHHFHGIIVESS